MQHGVLMEQFEEHSSEESLEMYALGRLRGPELEQLEEHLLICESCQDRLDTTEKYVKAMQGAARRLRQEERSKAKVATAGALSNWLGLPSIAWVAAAATVLFGVLATM